MEQIAETFEFISRAWYGVLSLLLLALAVISVVTQFVVSRVGKSLQKRGFWPRGLSLVRKFFVPSQIFFISLTIYAVCESIKIPTNVNQILIGVAKVGMILSMMVILTRVVDLVAEAYFNRLRVDQPDNLRQRRLRTQLQFMEKVADLIIFFVAISAVLMSFESFRHFGGSLLASAGLASVIVGFSAQKSLGNLIAGFQIAFTQPIRLGDALLVENEWGEVEEITLTYVVVRIWDLRRMIVPITYFLEKPFQNWTRTSADLIGQVLLYVDYSLPVDELRRELKRILKASTLWDGKVQTLQVTDTTERTMTLRALMSARSAGTAFDLRCEVREKLILFIQEQHPGGLPKTRFEGDDPKAQALVPPPPRAHLLNEPTL